MKNLELKGIKYKSQGELRIAKFLDEINLNFEYEFPISIIDEDNKHRVWYPDFYLKEFQVVIEYFGIKGNENYDKGTKHKTDIFRKCGIEMIPIYYDDMQNEWIKKIKYHLYSIINTKNKIINKKLKEI